MIKRSILLLILFFSFIFFGIFISINISALTSTIQMNSTFGIDNHFREDGKTTNYGNNANLYLDSEAGKSYRPILQFDLSSISSYAIINDAELELYLEVASGASFNASLHRITKNWSEMNSNWNINGSINWATLGGDYDLNGYDVSFINNTLEWKSWNVTSLVRGWIGGGHENYGLIIIPESQGGNNEKRFASSENTNIILTPKIIIDYTPIIPISSCGQNLSAPGSYVLNQSITSTATCLTTNASNVEIDCGGNSIIYGSAGTASSYGIYALAPATQVNLTIKNCRIVKPSSAGSSGRGIVLTRFANSTILNNTILTNGTSSNQGIYIATGSDGNNISKNTIITSGTSSSNHGIYLYTGTPSSIIEYNSITTGKGTATTDNYGVYATDPDSVIISNQINTFGSGDSNYGILSSASTRTRIINNTIYTSGTTGNNRGIYLVTSDSNYIANNTINTLGQASVGIYLSSAGAVSVLNNQINSTADAIYLTSGNLNDFLLANISRDNTRFGRNISVYGGGDLTLPCPNNSVIDNPTDGGLKFFGCSNITIKNWYRPNRDTDGLLFVNSNNNKIINNTINGGLDGLDMLNAAGKCSNNTIVNNTLSSFGFIDSYAIHIYGSDNVISGNNLSTSGVNSGNNGINIRDDFNNITNNLISTGGTSGNNGINLESGAKGNVIQNNTITTSGTSGNTGIYLASTNTGNIIRSNTITATGTTSGNLGIRLVTNSNNNLIENNAIYTRALTSGNNGLDLSSSSNNIFKFNNIYAGYGVGTTDNDAISLVGSKNNTFNDNVLFANGTATSITSSSIFLQSASANNTFTNNLIVKSVGNAFELDFLTTYPSGNVFQNNSLNNVSGSDLFFLDANINGTFLINQPIGKYNFTGIGGTVVLEDTRFGRINFTSPINGSGSNLSEDIGIMSNFVQVSSLQLGLNKSANINLYNLPINFYMPIIKMDGLYECNTTTGPSCVNFTSLNAGNVSFSVSAWSNYSIVNSTDTIPPAITIVSPINTTYSINAVFLNYTVSDNRGISNCWYKIDSSPNIALPGCSTATISGLEEGEQYITISANDTSGNMISSTIYFTISSMPPAWSNVLTLIPNSYSASPSYFNITWTSSNSISNVIFESNFSGTARNYNMQNLGENVYGFSATLPAGSFYWRSFANDSSGKTNSTAIQTFWINKSGNPINLYLNNELNNNLSIIYGGSINASALAEGNVVLYRNGVEVSNPDSAILGVGLYNYTASVLESQNYTYNYSSYFANINQSSAALSLFINGEEGDESMIYGGAMNITAAINNEGIIKLLRDGELIGEDNIVVDSSVLGVGVYNYSVVFDGNENYSAGIKSFILEINKSQPSLSLLLNGEASDLSIPIYSLVNVGASLISPLTEAELYEDGVLIGNEISFNEERNYTSLGDRKWELIFDGNENYTNGSISYYISILDANFPQYSNLKRSPSSPTSYSPSKIYNFNSTWQDEVGIDDVLFEFNGVNFSFSRGEINRNGVEYNINFTGLAVGVYSYKWIGNDTSGNLVVSPSQLYTVDKGIAALFLTVSPDSSMVYGINSSVSCSANNLESSPVLTRNMDVVNNPNTAVLGVGSYNYACTSIATANYTSASTTSSLNVERANPVINLKINNASQDLSISSTLEVLIEAELVSPDSGNLTLLVNGENITGENYLNFTASFSSTTLISAIFDGDENYTAGIQSYSIIYTPYTSGGGGGSSGGGGSGGVIINKSIVSGISADMSGLGDVVFSPGESKSLSVSVKNRGTSFLNNCKLVGKGNYSSWISGRTNKGLAAGEIVEFVFNLNAPNGVASGDYDMKIALQCKEGNYEKAFEVHIVDAKLNLEILDVKTQAGMLEIFYSLQDLSNSEQNIEIEFSLIDDLNVEVVRDSKIIVLNAEEKKEEKVIMTIPDDLVGEHTLILNAKSEVASIFGREKVLLGSSGTGTGFALLSQQGERIVPITIIIAGLLIGGYFLVKRIFRGRLDKGVQGESGIIKIQGNKKGVMIIDSGLIEHMKKHAENHDVKGKWIHITKKDLEDS